MIQKSNENGLCVDWSQDYDTITPKKSPQSHSRIKYSLLFHFCQIRRLRHVHFLLITTSNILRPTGLFD